MCFKAKKTKEEVEQEAKNQEIEKLLKQDRAIEEKNIKILILGTGDSGKTTFTKQLTCLHGTLSKETLESYSFILKDLALRGAQTLINCAEETGVCHLRRSYSNLRSCRPTLANLLVGSWILRFSLRLWRKISSWSLYTKRCRNFWKPREKDCKCKAVSLVCSH
eukprot:TRINITY_DN3107_c0_g1_i25.p1 TRINITY_DN3107_c0_g1~~TRINITY_DN3107_c0_g1_i25.p1  ORF type:complete len:164 (+),score=6.86 TRINITY_DN3107_c0_g1_i25:29-520(+)